MANIAYIVLSLNPGGTERLVIDMAAAFKDVHKIRILCLDEPGLWAEDTRRTGIPVHCLYRQPGTDLTISVKLAAFAKRHRIDLFHAHQCTPWFYGGLSRWIYPGAKLLLEEHGRLHPEIDNPKRRWVNRLLINPMTSAATAVSRDIGNRLARYEGLDRSRIQVIYNGVNPSAGLTPAERKNLRQAFGLSSSDVVAGFVGRLDAIKNLPLLLEGVTRVKRIRPELRCLIIGNGPLMPDLADRVRRSGLDQTVILAGFRTDAARLVNLMDLFCLVSFSEGTSMALLEAMAAGVPAIVTDVGGNPEIVDPERTGWVVPSDDADAFAAVLETAVSEPGQRQKRGINARDKYESMFSFDGMINQYRRVYGRLLSGG